MSKIKKILRVAESVLRSKLQPTPVQINVLPSYECNLSCDYCSQYDNNSEKMDLAAFKSVVEKGEELHVGYFNFTGGEPLLWNPLIDAVAFLTDRNFASHLNSNGFCLDDRMVEQLGKAGLDSVIISLDGIAKSEKSLKTLSEHDGGLTRRLHHLRDKYRVLVKLNTVVDSRNANQVPLLIEYAQENRFLLSVGLEVPRIGSQQTVIYRNLLRKELKEATPSQKWFLIEPEEYFDTPVFDCVRSKRNSLSVGPGLQIQYCFKNRRTAKKITDFNHGDYHTYLGELKKHLDWCNPLCASNCGYMGYFLQKHPTKLINLMCKELVLLYSSESTKLSGK